MLDLPQNCRILIQGIEQPAAAIAMERMAARGATLVAGVGGANNLLPTFNLVEEAQAAHGPIDIALLFSPPWQILDAALEAMAGGIRRLVIATKGVPPLDGLQLLRYGQRTGSLILGSGSVGLIAPNRLLLGSFDRSFFQAGGVGLICRSESLAYEVATVLQDWHLGQSVVAHLGSDSILGSTARDWLELLERDEATKSIVLVGDIPRDELLEATVRRLKKRVVAYHPRLNGSLAPLSDAAQLLRAARRSRSVSSAESRMVESVESTAQSQISVVNSIQQIPEAIRANAQASANEAPPPTP
jgi:succinyl-CoA synthetase alpha subunit